MVFSEYLLIRKIQLISYVITVVHGKRHNTIKVGAPRVFIGVTETSELVPVTQEIGIKCHQTSDVDEPVDDEREGYHIPQSLYEFISA